MERGVRALQASSNTPVTYAVRAPLVMQSPHGVSSRMTYRERSYWLVSADPQHHEGQDETASNKATPIGIDSEGKSNLRNENVPLRSSCAETRTTSADKELPVLRAKCYAKRHQFEMQFYEIQAIERRQEWLRTDSEGTKCTRLQEIIVVIHSKDSNTTLATWLKYLPTNPERS